MYYIPDRKREIEVTLHYSCIYDIIFKDVQEPQLPTGSWPGGPYKGRETMIKWNVSQFNPLLMIGNRPSTSLTNHSYMIKM